MEQQIKEDKLGGNDGGKYDEKGSAQHYKDSVIEYVDMQCLLYGTFMAYGLCFMQVDKYRGRAGKKEGVPADKDLVKANFYEKSAQYLKEIIDAYNSNYTSISKKDLEIKYGRGRARYIQMPEQLSHLLNKEFDIMYSDIPFKGLAEIVNDKLK